MKKLFKSIIAVAFIGTLGAAFAGCAEEGVKGEAYGLTHGAGYVGYASVTVSGDKVTDAYLNEVCLPTYVTAGEDVLADDKVTVGEGDGATSYYKIVSYGEVTLTYDVDDGYKTADGKTLKEYFASEENAEAYYEAVMNGSVTVTVGTEKKNDVMTKAALSKEDNGYWSSNLGTRLGWKANRDKTLQYVKEYGVDNLLQLTLDDSTWKDGSIDTGATWADFNSVKEGSLSYAQLLTNAYNAAKSK